MYTAKHIISVPPTVSGIATYKPNLLLVPRLSTSTHAGSQAFKPYLNVTIEWEVFITIGVWSRELVVGGKPIVATLEFAEVVSDDAPPDLLS